MKAFDALRALSADGEAAMIEALAREAAGKPAAMLVVARLLQQGGQAARALEMCRHALSLAPEDRKLAAQARALVNAAVPKWHLEILRDERRNAAYDQALRRAVAPHSRVLDIGTGSGLLAMMAARAGAAAVIACERAPEIAEASIEIIRRNGYAERIQVIAKDSRELDADADLGGRVDVLVSEIISNDVLGQDVLPVQEHAVRKLLKPGGRIIPVRATVRVALAFHQDEHGLEGLQDIAGFDLSVFQRLAPLVRLIRVGDNRLALRSAPSDLFAFDFTQTRRSRPSQVSLSCRSVGGPVNGIVQWIRIELDDQSAYENRPDSAAPSCWSARFYPFDEPIATSRGDDVQFNGSHDRSSITIWR